jgi:hypothetical protein
VKRLFCALALCLSLLAASGWLIFTPAYAGGATATCRNGGSVTCTGAIDCQSHDYEPNGADGWCQCTNGNGGAPDVKSCSGGSGGGMLDQ